jgi:CO dehydrogenase maturation factor
MSQSLNPSKRLVAVCGKGGTGKTVFTAMMTSVLLESDKAGKLLLIDADPAMGLPTTLGVNVKRTMGQIREEIIRTARRGKEKEKTRIVDMLDYMVFEALNEMDSFALLAMGRTETLGCFCPVNDLLRGAVETLSKSFDTILIDGEAGLEQINRQVMRYVDTLIIVSDATSRGMQTAALIKRMVQSERVIQCERMGLVFNRVQGNEELLKQLAQEMGVEVFGYIPQDENIAYHDLVGKPIIELSSASPGLAAVRNIVERCIFQERFSERLGQ